MSAAIVLLLLAQISNRPSPVEVLAPMPPTAVNADGKRVLAYELHITNLGANTLVLRHIEVAGFDYSGDVLAKMLRPAGESPEPARLEPGRRVIAFVWLAFPLDARLPAKLRHRLTFDLTGDPSATQSVIDDIVVPVRGAAPPVISPPLSTGEWLAGSGPSNDSDHRRSVIPLEGRTWDAQRFAIDFVRIGSNGNTFHDDRSRNENFWTFGQPVHAVADGEVTDVVDAYPDNTPGTTPPKTIENLAGNRIIVRIAADEYVLFAHLQQHSIRVRLHQKVRRGDVLANIGNSGNSTSAHLHFQLMDRNASLAAEGIPFVFDRFTFLGHGRDFEEGRHPNEPRKLDLPVDDEVIGIR